jgi:hypothetical protein
MRKIIAAGWLLFAVILTISVTIGHPPQGLATAFAMDEQGTGSNATGYTIYVRPQGQIANSYPTTFTRKAWQPPCYYIYSTDTSCRTELWEDSTGTATYGEIITACPALKPQMITQVEQIRATALGRSVTTNTGVMAVYQENYQAAVARLNGQQDIVLMKNNMTAEEYLTGLGSQIGMDSLQFAQYVIAESISLAPKAYEIEQEYLRLKYQVIPNTTSVAELMLIPVTFQTFSAP